MANTSDIGRAPAGERTGGRGNSRRGSGIVVAGDRTHSFRAARRHSSRVRILRWALPAVAAVVLGAYAVTVLSRSDLVSKLPEIAIPEILPENLTMDNPHYEGFGKDGSSYAIRASTAQQSLKDTSLVRLNGIEAEIVEADKKRTTLKAARGVFNHTTSLLELEEAIDIASDAGLKAKLSRAVVETKSGLVTSREPVAVEFPGGTIGARALTLNQKAREISFETDVKARLTPPARDKSGEAKKGEAKSGGTETAGTEPGGTKSGETKPAASPAGPFAASDAPVDISAQRLDIRDKDKIAVFKGDVVAVQGESALAAPELEVHYAGAAGAQDAAGAGDRSDTSSALPGAGKLSKIVAKGPVTLTRGPDEKVTSDSAEFATAEQKAVLAGSVVMTSGADRRVFADRADLDSGAGTALLTGDVVLKSGKNELKGRRLFIDNQAKRMQLSSPGGRIAARFVQGERKGKSADGAGAAASSGFATFKTDPNAPVDIEADTLDANDAAKTATFRGKVKAVQGGFTILTAELQASYTGGAGLGDMTGGAKPPEGGGSEAQLTKIEARKKVTVKSSDGQMVNGDWAVFDTLTDTVTVGGDVLLSQGKNVVRGTRLVIDMRSGQSTIETAGSKAAGNDGWAAQSPAGPGGTPGQGRPSAVFYPDQLREMRDGGDTKTAPSDAWKASTLPHSSGQGASR